MIRKKVYGFTLVELLVVIAVLGVLAAAVLIAINPLEQLARGRDAGRKSTVAQLGKAVVAFYTINGYYPPAATNTWMQALQNTGDLKSAPPDITPHPKGIPCYNWTYENNYCYYSYDKGDGTGLQAYVWTNIESQSEQSKCAANGNMGVLGFGPYYVYDTSQGSTCLKCPDAGGNYQFDGVCNAKQ